MAGFVGLAAAVVAARRAKSAESAARGARAAVLTLGRVARLDELWEDFADLESLLDHPAGTTSLPGRLHRLSARTAKFQADHGGDVREASRGRLEQAADQVDVMLAAATRPRLSTPERVRRLRAAYNLAVRALNEIRGDEKRRLAVDPGPAGGPPHR